MLFTLASLVCACSADAQPEAATTHAAGRTRSSAPFAKQGNIFLKNAAGKVVQLTTSGKDRSPTRSPDRRNVAFIRKSAKEAYLSFGRAPEYQGDDLLADQIWLVDTKTGKEKMLVEDRPPGVKGNVTRELERTIAAIEDDSLCFSPDGAELYFISSAWVTSGALHVVNLRTSRTRFITAALSVEVVPSGKYAGNLIVQQHRHFLCTGTYNWWWLMTPKGREIGPIGESAEQVKNFKKTYH